MTTQTGERCQTWRIRFNGIGDRLFGEISFVSLRSGEAHLLRDDIRETYATAIPQCCVNDQRESHNIRFLKKDHRAEA